jgi:hypothetical protein
MAGSATTTSANRPTGLDQVASAILGDDEPEGQHPELIRESMTERDREDRLPADVYRLQ